MTNWYQLIQQISVSTTCRWGMMIFHIHRSWWRSFRSRGVTYMAETLQNQLTRQDHLDQNQFFSASAAGGKWLWRLCTNATHTAAFCTLKRWKHTFFARYQCPERESKSQGFSSVAQRITVLVLDSQIFFCWHISHIPTPTRITSRCRCVGSTPRSVVGGGICWDGEHENSLAALSSQVALYIL